MFRSSAAERWTDLRNILQEESVVLGNGLAVISKGTGAFAKMTLGLWLWQTNRWYLHLFR